MPVNTRTNQKTVGSKKKVVLTKKVTKKAAKKVTKKKLSKKKITKKTKGIKVTTKTSVADPVIEVPKKKKKTSFDFIGFFPTRKVDDSANKEQKKATTGPIFEPREIVVGFEDSSLNVVQSEDFRAVFLAKHKKDDIRLNGYPITTDNQQLFTALINKEIDCISINMSNVPINLPEEIVVGAHMQRLDPRDVMVTNSPFGAIQELPKDSKIACTCDRQLMQVKNLRPDLEVINIIGQVKKSLDDLAKEIYDAVLLPWSSLKKLNISPRFYSALLVDHMVPAVCQGVVGLLTRAEDADLKQRLKLIEDSEASWSCRCERAFLRKLGGTNFSPLGAQASRKGTQDPWILETVVGDPANGDVIKYREIGTSRCKPESLAEKAFAGISARGARRFMPF